MRLRIFTEPQQGASYGTLRHVAKAAEDLGFDAFFRSDHYLRMGSGSGEPGPTDAWATLVAQVDEMSGGRVEFGLGTGWYDGEHRAYGIPFPPLKERFDRFEEQLAIITGLWSTPVGQTFSYDGGYYSLTDSPALPKPVQRPKVPVIIGGGGARRTPALAARYADEFNAAFRPASDAAAAFERVRGACAAEGRDPASMILSTAQVVCCGKDEAELARRAAAIGRELSDLRENGLAGSPAEIVDKIGAYAEAGATTAYLQVLDLADLDHLDLLASQVLPQV
jgi:alkanesulfonate monooxygenase SsuD/methylene tetrahydromethanopterin reductase-like flavin-dependent oxidoreductase (luciferase family)